VVAKDAWREPRSLGAEEDRAGRIGQAPTTTRVKHRDRPAIDWGMTPTAPSPPRCRARCSPFRGVHGQLANHDTHRRAGADDEQQDQSDGAVHGEPGDGEVAAGDARKIVEWSARRQARRAGADQLIR